MDMNEAFMVMARLTQQLACQAVAKRFGTSDAVWYAN